MASLRRFFFSLALVPALAATLSACAAEDDVATGDDDVVSGERRTIPVDEILTDDMIEGGQAITVAQVQSFLESKKSALATFKEADRSAAQWIVEEAQGEKISPLYMLTRLETESGLVTSGSLDNIKSATGCGCPDTAKCDPKFANFGPQVRCAAQLMRRYFTALDTKKVTVSGWKVGGKKTTLDPCEVTPKNRATAALYTYNPWVGAYGVGCGSSKWGGATLIGRLYRSYASAFPNASQPGKEDKEPTSTTGGGTTGGGTTGGGTSKPEPQPASQCPKDGLFCGGNGASGLASELFKCTAGKASRVESCENGCVATPPGGADYCRP